MRARVVVLGAGFGGLELTTRLSAALGREADVVLIDKAEGFVFGFSKLDVMFGRISSTHALHPYRDLVHPGVRFVSAEVRSIDPATRRVETDAGSFEADILVVALGADLDPTATPGLVEGGYEFYSVAGAFAVREVLAEFAGGRVVVGVTSTPFKCPPAPSETVLMLDELLTSRGLRDASDIALVMPFAAPVPPSPDASAALLEAFAERGIRWVPETLVLGLDPERRVALLSDGTELAYDLFLGVPPHRVPDVVARSGLVVDGWVPVDPLTLETAFPGVYAVGDVANAGTPKAGVFAEGHGAVAAARILDRLGGRPATTTYDGHGTCYLDFGDDQVAKVEVSFGRAATLAGALIGPSSEVAADKAEFGTSRIARWFGREWSTFG